MTMPKLGDVVHYRSHGSTNGDYVSTCRAAIVTDVSQDSSSEVSLCVLNPEGMYFSRDVAHDEALTGGTWHHREDS